MYTDALTTIATVIADTALPRVPRRKSYLCVVLFILLGACSGTQPPPSVHRIPKPDPRVLMALDVQDIQPLGPSAAAAAAGRFPRMAAVTAPAGQIRSAPQNDAPIVATLTPSQYVMLAYEKGDWYRVQLSNGGLGWAERALFDADAPVAAVAPAPSAPGLAAFSPQAPAKPRIRSIRPGTTQAGEEQVLFLLDDFSPPHIFVLEDGPPRVVCDFFGAELSAGIGTAIAFDGRMIQRIRTGSHQGQEPKIRVVIDLVPGREYQVDQAFIRTRNIYAVTLKQR